MAKDKPLPDHVYPCGVKFTVRLEHMDTSDYADFDGHERAIRINPDPKKDKDQMKTLFHEYLHGIFHCTGLSEVMPSENNSGLEEALATALEEHLFHLIDPKKMGKRRG